jgi:hypothetical protein
MKTCLIILLNFVTIILFGQTRNDTVDFKNINHSLLNELIFEKCNNERVNASLIPFLKHEVCFSAAKYQSDYMSFYNVLCHINDFSFQNMKLKGFQDRVDYFSKKTKKEIAFCFEVCLLRHYFHTNKITYDNLSFELISQFMRSKPHRYFLMIEQVFDEIVYIGFSSTSNKDDEFYRIYVTGVSGVIFPKKIILN